jgi:hypothetical protein
MQPYLDNSSAETPMKQWLMPTDLNKSNLQPQPDRSNLTDAA